MSRKQDIYIELLQFVLPHLRNAAESRWGKGVDDQSAALEAELVHELPTLLCPEFTIRDVCFLNVQASIYCERCNPQISSLYNHHLPLFRELFALVPAELRHELNWAGP